MCNDTDQQLSNGRNQSVSISNLLLTKMKKVNQSDGSQPLININNHAQPQKTKNPPLNPWRIENPRLFPSFHRSKERKWLGEVLDHCHVRCLGFRPSVLRRRSPASVRRKRLPASPPAASPPSLPGPFLFPEKTKKKNAEYRLFIFQLHYIIG